MASLLSETTVAAPSTPFLRASVNAVRGPGSALARASEQTTAKVGNATLAQVDTLPKGRDAKQARCASKGSAVAKRCAQTKSLYSLKDVG
jgi:hypothetical protein